MKKKRKKKTTVKDIHYIVAFAHAEKPEILEKSKNVENKCFNYLQLYL